MIIPLMISSPTTVVTTPPVVENAIVTPIVIGDDYLSPDRAFTFDVDPPTSFAVGAATCFFGGSSYYRGSWAVAGTIAAVTVDGQPKWRMTFELPRAVTVLLKAGCFNWTAELRGPAPEHTTKLFGTVEVIDSYTTAA